MTLRRPTGMTIGDKVDAIASGVAKLLDEKRRLVEALRALVGQCLLQGPPREFLRNSALICQVCERVSPNGTEHDDDCEAAAALALLEEMDR